MKIVIFANSSGGLYSFRKELIETFVEKDNSVVALTPFDDMVSELKNIGIKLIETPIDRRGINPIKDISLFHKYKKKLKILEPDLVITYTIKPNIYGGFACRLLKIPYAVNITGLGTAFQKDGLLRKLVTFMYKISLKMAKTVFFENSENMQIFLDEKIITRNQTCLLNGAGVNLEHFSLLEYPQDCEKTRFLFIGRVMKEKGIDELFEAMEKLITDGVKCSLDIVGNYEEDYADQIKKYESEGWLHYRGFQKDVRPFIEKCHCFVLPSWHEGMANTNLECAASGRPLITSNIAGCREAVVNGESGFLAEKQNANSLYEAMKKFTQLSYDERKAMGLVGRKHMVNAFDKKKVVEETIYALSQR